ncbi:MAG: methyltransferase domain-containing protein [Eubacteriales bacterium]|nr:methyltransferase domain-containing protein [Eubacteriales bacterium]
MFFDLNMDMPYEASDLKHFKQLYNYQRPSHMTAEDWDLRAKQRSIKRAKKNSDSRLALEARLDFTVDFLLRQGALNREYRVLDAGCAEGDFVLRFAEHCHLAEGFDLSPAMIDEANKKAKAKQLENVNFWVQDATCLDESIFAQPYDLVFASITPASNHLSGLDRLIRLSRRHLLLVNFVRAENYLDEAIHQSLVQRPARQRFDCHHHYALMNLFFLAGYDPVIDYFEQIRRSPIDDPEAERRRCLKYCTEAGLSPEAALPVIETELTSAIAEGGLKTRFTFAYLYIDLDKKGRREIYPREADFSLAK